MFIRSGVYIVRKKVIPLYLQVRMPGVPGENNF